MTLKNRTLLGIGGCLSVLLLLALGSCTIVRHDQKGNAGPTSANSGEFDSVGYVEANWSAKIMPELTANAAELSTVLAALKADPEAARAKYGRRQEETAPFTFIVRGSVPVKAANLESAAATLELATPAPTADGAVLLQIGPVIKSSAVRDVLSFVHFGDFTNQVDFANLSRALNAHVKDSVVNALDREHLVSKTVSFTGAFAEDASGKVLITPVLLEVKK
jgi:predicted lipoprotein